MLAKIKRYWFCYVWIAPFFLLFLVFQAYPFVNSFFISLFDWSGFTAARFIGLENFAELFQDELFYRSLVNNVVLWALIIPLRTFIALLLAAILNSPKVRAKAAFRIVYLLPHITAIVLVAVIFRMLLATNGGMVNLLLGRVFGMEPIEWLTSTRWSKVSIAMMNIWRNTGYFMIIMLAGMQRIPIDFYESAEIDGAGPVRQFLHITVPLMRPVIFFVVTVSSIWIFQAFAEALVLTEGGPQFSSTPIMLLMYRNAFEYFNVGYAGAITVVTFALILSISMAQLRLYGRGDTV